MLNGGFKNLPPDSWKPFGNGVRGCIGRPFAWQEVLLLVAMVRPSCQIFMLTYRSFNHSIFDLITWSTNFKLSIPSLSNLETSICMPQHERVEISIRSSVLAQRKPTTRKSIAMNILMELLAKWISVSFTVSLPSLDVDVS